MNDNDVKITGDFNELFSCRPCDDLQKLFPLFFEAYLAKSYVFFFCIYYVGHTKKDDYLSFLKIKYCVGKISKRL